MQTGCKLQFTKSNSNWIGLNFRQSYSFNSHGASWQQTAEILQNTDNGRNEHDNQGEDSFPKFQMQIKWRLETKIAQEIPSKIQRRIFWCYKNVPKNIFGGNFTGNEPKNARK